MSIRVELFGAFAEYAGTRQLELPYRQGMSCNELWEDFKTRFPAIAGIPPLFAIDEEYVRAETPLQDGDSVMLFPPVSGGMPSYIYETPLSVERALEAIRDPMGGGEAVFIGRVRRVNEGKVIRYLYYECQISMAEKMMDRIVQEIYQRWPVRRVHIEHRIGRLEVGEIAVIVAVSSEHRREAIEACRYGIDEIKHRVPIWKKEISEDGEEWIGACRRDSSS